MVATFPVAEVDALGRARQAGCYLGAAAAFDRRDLRAGDRGARHRAVRRRRHRGRRRDPRPSLPGAGAVQGAAASTITSPSSTRPRSCSIRRGARRSSCTDAKNLAFAQGFELVEDEGLLAEVAGLVEWPVVLMGAFDAGIPRDPARGDPHHHPHQPEMLRAARSADRASSPTSSSWSPTSRRATAARRSSPATSA